MLVLTLSAKDRSVRVGDGRVTLLDLTAGKVRVAFEFPREISIVREKAEQKRKATQQMDEAA